MSDGAEGISFGGLLRQHLRNGTRPVGKEKKPGDRWGTAEFAHAVGYSDRAVRLWLSDAALPKDLTAIELLLFGRLGLVLDGPRQTLRDAYGRLEMQLADMRKPAAVEQAVDSSTAANIAELLELARKGRVFERAKDEGISEAAVRQIVARLGGEGIDSDGLVPWLDGWIEAARTQLGRHTDEDVAFEAARREAERRFRTGEENATAVLMEEFLREETVETGRQEERKRRRLGLLEEAVRIDELTLAIKQAVVKLKIIADIEGQGTPPAVGPFLVKRANEIATRGEAKGQNPALLLAIAVYRAALDVWAVEVFPIDRAVAQRGLADALTHLGERERGISRLEEAVQIYKEALEILPRLTERKKWTSAKDMLGGALLAIGQRKRSAAILQAALEANNDALSGISRDEDPLGWAGSMTNRGTILWALDGVVHRTEWLQEAIDARRQALEIVATEGTAYQRATAMNNLAVGLSEMAQRREETDLLFEAGAIYVAALELVSRESHPLLWAMIQHNMGASFMQGSLLPGLGQWAMAAASAFRAALEERDRDRVPLDWADSKHGLAVALNFLGRRLADQALLREALAAVADGLTELPEDKRAVMIALREMIHANIKRLSRS